MASPEDRKKEVTNNSMDMSGSFSGIDPEENLLKKKIEPDDYTSGESEIDENRLDFSSITNNLERMDHFKEMWRMVYLKAYGAHLIDRTFKMLHNRILQYGTTKNISLDKKDKI